MHGVSTANRQVFHARFEHSFESRRAVEAPIDLSSWTRHLLQTRQTFPHRLPPESIPTSTWASCFAWYIWDVCSIRGRKRKRDQHDSSSR